MDEGILLLILILGTIVMFIGSATYYYSSMTEYRYCINTCANTMLDDSKQIECYSLCNTTTMCPTENGR